MRREKKECREGRNESKNKEAKRIDIKDGDEVMKGGRREGEERKDEKERLTERHGNEEGRKGGMKEERSGK